MSEQLKPCPFCGGPARLFQKYRDPKPYNWRVCCDNDTPDRGSLCWMENPYADFDSVEEAIAAWNRRAPVTDGAESPTTIGQAPQ